ncbi:MAG: hypothetical protein ACXVYY_01075 [Oryzihumus sp.]
MYAPVTPEQVLEVLPEGGETVPMRRLIEHFGHHAADAVRAALFVLHADDRAGVRYGLGWFRKDTA